jgi:hypothetical protein
VTQPAPPDRRGSSARSPTDCGNTNTVKEKRRRSKRRPGRPATGRDPIVPVRLPRKLLADIEAWLTAYRNEHELVMTRSAAVRSLILLGLESVKLRAVDPKTKLTDEGATLPLLRFYRRGVIDKWLREGTGKPAKRIPPAPPKLSRVETMPSKSAISAATDRAEARSKQRSPG